MLDPTRYTTMVVMLTTYDNFPKNLKHRHSSVYCPSSFHTLDSSVHACCASPALVIGSCVWYSCSQKAHCGSSVHRLVAHVFFPSFLSIFADSKTIRWLMDQYTIASSTKLSTLWMLPSISPRTVPTLPPYRSPPTYGIKQGDGTGSSQVEVPSRQRNVNAVLLPAVSTRPFSTSHAPRVRALSWSGFFRIWLPFMPYIAHWATTRGLNMPRTLTLLMCNARISERGLKTSHWTAHALYFCIPIQF